MVYSEEYISKHVYIESLNEYVSEKGKEWKKIGYA